MYEWCACAETRVRCATADRQKRAAARSKGKLDRFALRGDVEREIELPAYSEILRAPYRVIYRVDKSRVTILTLWRWRRA